jgi:hypothetical protein
VRVVIEPAVGVVDGTNRVFETTVVYKRGTLIVYQNGRALRRAWENGWVELPANRFKMKEAPLLGDDLQVQYLPGGS